MARVPYVPLLTVLDQMSSFKLIHGEYWPAERDPSILTLVSLFDILLRRNEGGIVVFLAFLPDQW